MWLHIEQKKKLNAIVVIELTYNDAYIFTSSVCNLVCLVSGWGRCNNIA